MLAIETNASGKNALTNEIRLAQKKAVRKVLIAVHHSAIIFYNFSGRRVHGQFQATSYLSYWLLSPSPTTVISQTKRFAQSVGT